MSKLHLQQTVTVVFCMYLLGTACKSQVVGLSKCYTSHEATKAILPSLLARASVEAASTQLSSDKTL